MGYLSPLCSENKIKHKNHHFPSTLLALFLFVLFFCPCLSAAKLRQLIRRDAQLCTETLAKRAKELRTNPVNEDTIADTLSLQPTPAPTNRRGGRGSRPNTYSTRMTAQNNLSTNRGRGCSPCCSRGTNSTSFWARGRNSHRSHNHRSHSQSRPRGIIGPSAEIALPPVLVTTIPPTPTEATHPKWAKPSSWPLINKFIFQSLPLQR